MIASVHIPIYCGSEKAKAGALLTLKTVRMGFPTKRIIAHWMGDSNLSSRRACNIYDVEIVAYPSRCFNWQLISDLVTSLQDGFAVVDSDMVFFDSCESFETDALMAGEFIPEFFCPIANARTISRLHTAFLVFPDPELLRAKLKQIHNPTFPEFLPFEPFAPMFVWRNGVRVFYDSCSNLFHSVGGKRFDDSMLEKFEHVYSGSYAYKLPWPHQQFIDDVFENPCKAKGFRSVMQKFFSDRKIE